MHQYKYTGYDSKGQKTSGELTAGSVEEVERRMAAQEITVVAILPAGFAKKGGEGSAPSIGSNGLFKSKISDADTSALLRDLSVMAETGVPFIEALDAVVATAKNKVIEDGLRQFRAEIVGGRGLSQAMRAANGVFPPLVCEMVKVAEEGGRLDLALSSAAAYVERSAELRKRVKNAMMYPIVLSVIAAATLSILIVFVIPRFATIFTKMNAKIPATTLMLLKTGTFVKSHILIVAGGLIAAIFLVRALIKTPAVHHGLHNLLIKVPVLGELLKRLALSRALQSMSTLTSSNISLMVALEHGAKVAGNPVIERALSNARTGVEHGASLSDSLAETGSIPKMLIQMVAVGERTGRLSPLMAATAKHMEDDVDTRLKALVSIIEPLMIVVMGVIVGGITMSIIIPMYSVVQNVK